ncbi:hypothetical protein [Stenotrophomonas maltophilia]|uniref:hypothetical protein n=1 Tax=Stenotrophomonas maltophilia TaxID=40324 RepID=UPI000C14B62C|nr:hypothetical protein [Stenotrophomonas maltophilia]ELF4099619.1 hypothetical protein [Stenotrophomonas maltophilia]MBN5141378.1 hypothetical protein [Stenotrophomonas maltophilia]WQI19464.1 hypothetical protein U2S91_15110 [Stenotrophomonas maltophilia]
MISTGELTVGSASSCALLSLILPRHNSEDALLLGMSKTGKKAVLILTGGHQFTWFEAEGADRWVGLVFSDVHIEIDETSVFSADYSRALPGNLAREGTTLFARAKAHALGASDAIILESELAPAHDLSAGFTRWQIVSGSGSEKRVLYRVGQASDAA